MFKYDFKKKSEGIKRVVDFLKKVHGVEVATSEAGKLAYLLSQRQLFVDSIEIIGQDVQTGFNRKLLLKVTDIRRYFQHQ